MPIQVQGPDGKIIEFPDGTPTATMESALRAHYGAPKADFSNVNSHASTVAVPEAPSMLDQVGRGFDLGTRAALEGIGSTIGIASDPIAAIGDRIAGRPVFGTARQGFSSLADAMNLPLPQTPAERISGDVTGALAGGGGLIGMGRSLAMRAPGIAQAAGEFLSSQPASQLASIVGGSGAAGVTREAGGSERAQGLAGLIGGLGVPASAAATQGGLRWLARGGEAGRQAMERGISDFRSLGVSPSVGQATGNRRTQGLESLLSGAPTSSARMASFAERQAEGIGAGLQNRAGGLFANASAERAGRAVERGVDSFAGDVKATRNALYQKADQLIPPNTALPLTRTWQTLDALVSPTPGATATTGALVNPRIAQLAKSVADDLAANGGNMPYEAVRALRSRIGEELSDFSLVADRPTAQYKRLYAALSDDLEEAARRQGPAAEQAYKRANAYTRASADRLEQIQRVVDKNGGPEKVYSAVMSGTKDGGTTLRAVMQSLPADGQKAVTAAVIKRMGMPTPGQAGLGEAQFSAQHFLTNWRNTSPEARRALFDRYGPQFSQNMDKVARVAERIRDGSKVFANPSGTANRAAAFSYYGSLPAAGVAGLMGAGPLPLAGLVITGLGANGAARVFTSPRVVSWLARTTELPASALPQQINVLKQMKDPDAAEVAAELERNKPIEQ